MSRDKLLPPDVQAEIITALYADANRLGWQTLAPTDRSAAYSAWVEDARVGALLTKYMTPEQARSWIKDGPMKEYGRALRGAGRYAAFGHTGGTGPADVVRHALGADASVIDGSVGSKPLHCLVETEAGTAYVVWGDSRNYRNLLWAALRAAVRDSLDAHIVVLEPPDAATPGDEVKEQRALVDRCGLHLHHMRETLGTLGADE